MFHLDVVFKSGKETYRTAAVAALSGQTQVLFVGSSHVKMGIRPKHFSVPVMNLDTDSLDYKYAEQIIKANLKKAPNVRFLCLEYDDVPITASTIEVQDGDYTPFYELGLSTIVTPDNLFTERIRMRREHWVYDNFYPIDRLPRMTPVVLFYYLNVNKILNPRLEEEKNLAPAVFPEFEPGFVPNNGLLQSNQEVSIAQEKFRQFSRFFQGAGGDDNTRRQTEAFCRTLDFLKSRKIKIILLRLPHPNVYWKYRPTDFRIRFDNFSKNFTIRYDGELRSKSILVWDLGMDGSFSRADFCDADHLNLTGANKLSSLLDKRLKVLLRK